MSHRALEHKARAFVALLLAALAALTLAACGSDSNQGGSSGGDSTDARTILNDAFSGTQAVRSGRVALDVRLTDGTGPADSLTMNGAFQSLGEDQYPKFDIAFNLDMGGQGSIRAGMISTGDRLFVDVAGSDYEIPSQYLDQAQQQSGGRGKLPIPDLDPQSWIVDPKLVGDEQVAGTETQHVTGTVNVPALIDSIDKVLREADRAGLSTVTAGQLPTSIPARARAEILSAVRDPRVDVWTGKDDKTLRRLAVSLDVAPRGGRPGHVTFAVTLSDLNKPQTIVAPRNVQPLDDLLSGLSALMGGSGLSGALPGGSGSGAGAATDDYGRCLQQAGTDVAKAQKCADLLTN
ncbi:MAG TPA: hypothetical protein VGM91_04895 [Conexibacter sp.]